MMNEQQFFEALCLAFRANGLALPDTEKGDKLYRLTGELRRVNAYMNLTAITEETDIIVRHYCDCALTAGTDCFPHGANLADIGAGAGFPTLPLAILRPDLSITAVDSTAKRMEYVSNTAHMLGLKRVQVHIARAEEMGQAAAYRESFDCVTARAVAKMNVLSEWCLPLVKPGGVFVAMKGAGGSEELCGALSALRRLSGAVREDRAVLLTDPFQTDSGQAQQTRHIIIVAKTGKTDARYPRSNGQIKKNPL